MKYYVQVEVDEDENAIATVQSANKIKKLLKPEFVTEVDDFISDTAADELSMIDTEDGTPPEVTFTLAWQIGDMLFILLFE